MVSIFPDNWLYWLGLMGVGTQQNPEGCRFPTTGLWWLRLLHDSTQLPLIHSGNDDDNYTSLRLCSDITEITCVRNTCHNRHSKCNCGPHFGNKFVPHSQVSTVSHTSSQRIKGPCPSGKEQSQQPPAGLLVPQFGEWKQQKEFLLFFLPFPKMHQKREGTS